MRHITLILSLALGVAGPLSGCGSKYPEVSKKKCGELVSKAQKLLGDRADPSSKLMADCKAATAEARGCAMAADSPADLLRCSM